MTRGQLETLADEFHAALVQHGIRVQASRSTLRAISLFGVTHETYAYVVAVVANRMDVAPVGVTGIVILTEKR